MISAPTALPERMGVMILPNAVLLPGSMVPLFIFEPRYREMLAKALETERVFAIASPLADETDDSQPGIGGAGVIRACVKNPDGTSHLVLQGFTRVRLSHWDAESSYPLASAEALPSVVSDPGACRRLRKEVLGQISRLTSAHEPVHQELLESLEATSDPALFSDLAASSVVGDSAIRQLLLLEADARRRLEILAALLTQAAAAPPEAS